MYLVTPSSQNAEAQQVRFTERAAAAGVRHLVKLSQFAVDETSTVRFLRYHAAVERRIRELGIAYTFLRPNLYFQGLLAFQPMIAAIGQFVAPIGDARVSAVDVRDIAAVAAAALTGSAHEGKTYTITGPAAITHVDMAAAIGHAVGRPVTFVDVPPGTFAAALGQAGVPQWQVDGLVEDTDTMREARRPRSCQRSARSPERTREMFRHSPVTTRPRSRDDRRRLLGAACANNATQYSLNRSFACDVRCLCSRNSSLASRGMVRRLWVVFGSTNSNLPLRR
jgi:nucleoside-diphosphate-sugar epimerase